VMSPTTSAAANDIPQDENYDMWEFIARMALARKDLLVPIEGTPEPEKQGYDPNYQVMIREAMSAFQAWTILRVFFVKKNLYNRVQMQKELHAFAIAAGDDLMQHLLQFHELCARLAAVGHVMADEERLVVLLGSLSSDYDGMVRIIESCKDITLLDAKEMLRRELREVQEKAFKAVPRKGNGGRGQGRRRDGQGEKSPSDTDPVFSLQGARAVKGEHVVLASNELFDRTTWLVDSGASSHTYCDRSHFVELKPLNGLLSILIANGKRVTAQGTGTVRLVSDSSEVIVLTEALYVPDLDRRDHVEGEIGEVRRRGMLDFLGNVVLRAPKRGKLYEWNSRRVVIDEAIAASIRKEAAHSGEESATELWHAGLGHIFNDRMASLVKQDVGVLRFRSGSGANDICAGCARWESTLMNTSSSCKRRSTA
ncbi:TPA: hypothetical protein N0F65_000902, partial [Lagenidium giganteum]